MENEFIAHLLQDAKLRAALAHVISILSEERRENLAGALRNQCAAIPLSDVEGAALGQLLEAAKEALDQPGTLKFMMKMLRGLM